MNKLILAYAREVMFVFIYLHVTARSDPSVKSINFMFLDQMRMVVSTSHPHECFGLCFYPSARAIITINKHTLVLI